MFVSSERTRRKAPAKNDNQLGWVKTSNEFPLISADELKNKAQAGEEKTM